MSFGWPAALLGLVALALPLAIHLLQRGRYRRIEVATTRFLGLDDRPRWRRIEPREPWLLALRVLLVILGVLLLTEPYGCAGSSPYWTVRAVKLCT